MDKKILTLNLDEEARYLAECTGLDLEEATSFVELENYYMDLLGLNVYDGDFNMDSHISNVVDEKQLNEFISLHSGSLSLDKCGQLQRAELEYFAKIGIVELD